MYIIISRQLLQSSVPSEMFADVRSVLFQFASSERWWCMLLILIIIVIIIIVCYRQVIDRSTYSTDNKKLSWCWQQARRV